MSKCRLDLGCGWNKDDKCCCKDCRNKCSKACDEWKTCKRSRYAEELNKALEEGNNAG